jgi:tRNA(Ile)-lysidine synthase
MNLCEVVHGFLLSHGPFDEPLVGFSGGADSTALLLALHQAGQKLTAVHCHHGLRGKSADDDAQWCEDFCRLRGIPFHLERLEVTARRLAGESCEEAGRRLRLDTWRRFGRPVFLAHHGDDQLENLFLRLARGANCSGLRGMRADTVVGGVRLLRPLLPLRRADIENWLCQQGVDDWREDATNADSSFRRNAIRNRLLPLWREIFGEDGGLRRSLEVLGEDAQRLDDEAEMHLPQMQSFAAWKRLPPALLPRVLRLWLTAETGTDRPLTHAACSRLAAALAAFAGESMQVPVDEELAIFVTQNGVELVRESPNPLQWNWLEKNELPWGDWVLTAAVMSAGADHEPQDGERFALKSLPPQLTVRAWRDGDRLQPFGAAFHRKVQDCFADAHVSRARRNRIPLICADDAIIWIPGVRRAEFGRLTSPHDDTVVLFCRRKGK